MATNELKAFLQQKIPFTPALFARGHAVFAPVLTWEWVKTPTQEEMQTQLLAAKRAGFGTVYILPMPARFRPATMVTELEGYLGDAFFRDVKKAAEIALSLGLRVWLYDEGGWPSGGACGQVTALLPDACEKRLRQDESGAPKVYENKARADIYSSRAAACFTRITHHAYAAALGETANAVDAIFTDEPAGAPNAVSDEIFEAFRLRYGYDLRAHLSAILSPDALSDAGKQVRRDYFELLEALFCNTMETYRRAAADRGWLLAGHLDRDHTADAGLTKGYGSTLRALKTADIPGVDAIGGQILSGGNRMDGEALSFYPRFAASAAAQKGTPLALSESFAVYGNALSGDEMRYIVNYQLARGITLFNFMQMPSTMERWHAFGERPVFHPAVPGFFALEGLNKETERACLFMAAGVHCAETALYYPHKAILGTEKERRAAIAGFRAAGEALERAGVDFDLIDADTLYSGEVRDGLLCCGGAAYASVIFPEGCAAPAALREKAAGLRGVASPLVSADIPGFLSRTARTKEGDLHVCVFNQNQTAVEAHVTVRTEKPLYLADVRAGTFSAFANGGLISLCPGQCAFLLATAHQIPVVPTVQAGEALPLLPVSAHMTKEYRLSEAGARLISCDEPLRFAEDFTAQTGAGFSGEVTLRYTFRTEKSAALLLRADRLWHFAEIFVNGARAGTLYAAPYALNIPAALLVPGENTLEIRVSNLAAAAYAAANAEEWFTPAQLGPYHAPALAFERQISGLGIAGLTLRTQEKQTGDPM